MVNSSIKSNFIKWYIQEYGVPLKAKDADVSLYTHTEEFKKFLEEEYQLDSSNSSVSMSDVVSFDFASVENIFSDLDDTENGSSNMMNVMSELFLDEEMIKLINGNSDTELNQDSFMEFIDSIRSLDGVYTDISLDDLINGLSMLEIDNLLLEEEQQMPLKTSSSRYNGSSSSSINGDKDKKIENYNDKDLADEINNRSSAFEANKDKLTKLLDGSNQDLSELKRQMDESYNALQDKLSSVDEKLSSEFALAKTNVDNQQSIVDGLNLKHINQQVLISDLSFKHTTVLNKVNSLNSTKAELDNTDTSNMTPEEANDIQDKKKNIELAISQAILEEQALNTQKQQAEAELLTIEQEKQQAQTLLSEYKNKRDMIETNVSTSSPEVKVEYENYILAKNNYYNFKDTQTNDTKNALFDSQNKVQEALKIQEDRKLKDEIKLFSPSPLSQYDEEWGRIISEAAKKYANEDHSTSCGASVRRVLESLGYDYIARCKGKEWAEQNMENSPDFVEVDFSLEDIKAGNVPIGSVVCFSEYDSFGYGDGKSGHVAIVIDNNGKICEASGYIRKAGINTNIIELGHGSVRIFVPTKRPD